jgi:hypothetical protein
MDAIEFVEQLRRMDKKVSRKYRVFIDSPEDVIAEVEEWAKKNPVKTRQSVFLEQFPNAPIYTNTHNVALDPCLVDTTLRGHCPTGRGCDICRREFWMQEVE